MVVGACDTQDGYDHIKGELIQIFGDKGKKGKKAAWREEEVRKRFNKEQQGMGVLCVEK